MKLNEVLAQIEEKNEKVKTFFESPESENPSQKQIEEIKDLNKSIEELEHTAADLMEREGIKNRANERARTQKAPVQNIPFPGSGNDASQKSNGGGEAKSLGHIFTDHPSVKQYLDQFEGRHVSGRIAINTPKVELNAGLKDMAQKALITGLSDTSAGAFVRTSYMNDISLPYRELSLRDVITVGRVNSDAIEYARATSVTNNAATVAEATATSGGTGVKPESDMVFEKVTATVRTIAHWLAVSNQALADADVIRTYINNFLVQGLEEEVEDQIMTDLAALSGISTEAYDTSLLKTTRKAITTAREQHARPTGWLMSLTDWESFDLLADGETRYYFGGPMVLGNPRLWGYPVIASEAVPTGYAYTGDLKTIVMWEREQATLSMTNSHSDFFIRNLVAILAEMRVAFGFLRPAAIVKVDLTA
jgi:HK97 family phage major capsid protein